MDPLETFSLMKKQISGVKTSIDSTSHQLNQNQNDLERLESTLSRLVGYQKTFDEHKKGCLEPELSPDRWQGTLSKEFDRFRKNDLQNRFYSLSNDQLEDAIVQLKQAITSTKLSISILEGSLYTQRIRLDTLFEMQRKESALK